MEEEQPTLYLIGGPNGAGKTTFAREYLPTSVKCLTFLNSDEIAKGLAPLNPQSGQIQAGKILLKNLRSLISTKQTFALESTLSGKTYLNYLNQAKLEGYRVILHFLWLPSAKESLNRVQQRVLEGGHNVTKIDIYRRFPRIMHHAFNFYLPLADEWSFWNASKLPLELVAKSSTVRLKELKSYFYE